MHIQTHLTTNAGDKNCKGMGLSLHLHHKTANPEAGILLSYVMDFACCNIQPLIDL